MVKTFAVFAEMKNLYFHLQLRHNKAQDGTLAHHRCLPLSAHHHTLLGNLLISYLMSKVTLKKQCGCKQIVQESCPDSLMALLWVVSLLQVEFNNSTDFH